MLEYLLFYRGSDSHNKLIQKRNARAVRRMARFERLEARHLLAATLFRVNAGGPELLGSPNWSADTSGNPSAYVNAAQTGNLTYTNAV
jgi:hypothetical protein